MKKYILILVFLITSICQGQLIGVVASSGTITVSEEFPQDNAAAASDDNSIGSFVANNVTVTSDGTTPHDGSYSIKIVGGTVAHGNGQITLTGLTIGVTYQITFFGKVNTAINQRINLSTGWTVGTNVDVDATSWTEYTTTKEAAATTAEVYFKTQTTDTTAGRELWIDLVTIEAI